MENKTIGISMIAGNAADTLVVFFEWARAHFTEINVVVQPRNYDNTLELCTEYAEKYPDQIKLQIHEFENFSAQLDRAIAMCTCDFVIVMGSDEILGKFPYEHIPSMLDRMQKDVGMLPRFNLQRDINHYNPMGYPDWQYRIIRMSSGVHYNGKVVDETLDVPIESCIGIEALPIIHFGHIRPEAALKQKGRDRKKFADQDACDGPQLNEVGTDWFIVRNKSWDEVARPVPAPHGEWINEWATKGNFNG